MPYCYRCGKEIKEDMQFCPYCAAKVQHPTQNAPIAAEPNALHAQEQDFLDTTYRLLRWEKKALTICGIVMLAMAGFFAVTYSLIGILYFMLGINEPAFTAGGIMFIIYAFVFAGIFLPVGIVQLTAARKIPYYLNTLYRDVQPAAKRCGSVGMLIFNILFGEVGFVFFLINFIRMRSHQQIIARIVTEQTQ